MSYGEDLLESYLKLIVPRPFLRNHRPEWLFGMELDFYCPEMKIALEFQGDHHYAPTSYCKDFEAVKRNDASKRQICSDRGIWIARIDPADLEYTRIIGKLKWHDKRFDKRNHRQTICGCQQELVARTES